jgi:hypothetical protein
MMIGHLASSTQHLPDGGEVSAEFDEVSWQPLEAETVNQLPSGHARVVRDAVARQRATGALAEDAATRLLARTG